MLCIVILSVSRDNRVSLWQLAAPRTEDELPGVECLSVVAGPGDSPLLTGAGWQWGCGQ